MCYGLVSGSSCRDSVHFRPPQAGDQDTAAGDPSPLCVFLRSPPATLQRVRRGFLAGYAARGTPFKQVLFADPCDTCYILARDFSSPDCGGPGCSHPPSEEPSHAFHVADYYLPDGIVVVRFAGRSAGTGFERPMAQFSRSRRKRSLGYRQSADPVECGQRQPEMENGHSRAGQLQPDCLAESGNRDDGCGHGKGRGR